MSAPVAQPAVPYLPLTRPTIDEATIAGVVDVLRSGWITSGPNVKALEGKLSEYFGGRPVRVFNSGTCTMEIALRIAGIGRIQKQQTAGCQLGIDTRFGNQCFGKGRICRLRPACERGDRRRIAPGIQGRDDATAGPRSLLANPATLNQHHLCAGLR